MKKEEYIFRIGDILKRKTSNHFVMVDSFITPLNDTQQEGIDLKVVIKPISYIDYSLGMAGISDKFGTVEEILEVYDFFMTNSELHTKKGSNKLRNLIKKQDKIDDKALNKLFDKKTSNSLKEEIEKIFKN